MTPADTILLGYDGSADSQRALAWATLATRSRNAPLRVLVASRSLNRRADVDVIRAEVERRLAAVEGISSTVGVADGAASHALLDAAKDAAMVVLGARGHGALSGALLGSVSQHISRYAPCPVAVIRQAYDAEAIAVVVGVDGSEDGEKALEFAFELAQRESRPLVAMHAWRPITPPVFTSPRSSYALPADLESATAEQMLRETLERWTEKYSDVSVTSHTVPQPAPHALADASQRAAVVVVGSRGRGAFAGLLLGSVGQAVLQRGQCPVIITR